MTLDEVLPEDSKAITAQQVRLLCELGYPVYSALARVTTYSISEISDLIRKGMISCKFVKQTLKNMNLVDCYVTEIIDEPYFQYDFWWQKVKYNAHGREATTSSPRRTRRRSTCAFFRNA